jgi:hypothetical protein
MKLSQVVFHAFAAVLGLSTLGVVPGWAQGTTMPPASPAPVSSDGGIGGIVLALVIVGLLVAIGVAVKLHDVKQKHDDEAAALQGRLSDALLQSSSALTITPTVHMSFRRSGLVTVTLTGLVPDSERREAAVQLAMREMEGAGLSFRIEDRIVVDPLMFKHAA